MTADLEHGSLHEVLAAPASSSVGAPGRSARSRRPRDDAPLLGIRVGDPLLVERRTIVDAGDRRIETTESRYAADRYALSVEFDVELPQHRPALAPEHEASEAALEPA